MSEAQLTKKSAFCYSMRGICLVEIFRPHMKFPNAWIPTEMPEMVLKNSPNNSKRDRAFTRVSSKVNKIHMMACVICGEGVKPQFSERGRC